MEKHFKRTLITTALPYANGPVHIGHLAGVYVPADIYARYLRLKGEEVLMIGGSDEHGVPITLRAKKEGITPQDVVDRYHGIIKKSFEEFGSGAKNTGKILPVPLGMKLTPLDIKLTDSQFFELKKYNALQIAGAFGVKPNQINDYSKSSYSNSEMQQLSFYVDTELFIIKQYEEEINFKMLPDEDTDDGYYYKFNEKVLFRTDSKTQMEYLRNGVGGMIIKPNEARRKLDMEDAEGGDVLLANGSIVPLTMAGAAYLKGESEQENTDEPEQPEEETEPDTEQPDTATEPDETDTAEDETDEEGGE